MKIKLKKTAEFISHVVVKNIPFFIVIGIVTLLDLGEFKTLLYGTLLPVIIAYTSGSILEEKYGGITAVIVMGGVLSQYQIGSLLEPIFIGALGGYSIKKYNEILKKYKYPGYEMLINNLGLAFIGLGLIWIINKGLPFYEEFQSLFQTSIISKLFNVEYLPLYSIIIEPSKVFFMNNFINHGIFSVLGISELSEKGKSIFFLLETNPGPGFGMLLAYFFTVNNKEKRKETLSNIFIHSIGGIHEVYFPYVLKNLKMILPLILGGMSGIFFFSKLNLGLVGIASPGSVFLIMILAPFKDKLPVLFAITASAGVSFLLSYIILKQQQKFKIEPKEEKETEKNILSEIENIPVMVKEYKNIYLVCDAGMGSSAMGLTFLRRKLEKNSLTGTGINIINCSIDNIKYKNPDIIIVHRQLLERTKQEISGVEIIIVDDFLDPKPYDLLIEKIKMQRMPLKKVKHTLEKKNIKLGLKRVKKEEALRDLGKSMYENEHVEEPYIENILDRESLGSTYTGKGIALPHGTSKGRIYIKKTGLVIHQYPYGIDFENGNTVYVLIGVAALEDEHIEIISKIADIIDDEKLSEILATTVDIDEVYKILCLEDECVK
jgi:PTS system mannitol-specific IIC component